MRLVVSRVCLMERRRVRRKMVTRVMARRKEKIRGAVAERVSNQRPMAGVERVTSMARCEETKLKREGDCSTGAEARGPGMERLSNNLPCQTKATRATKEMVSGMS